MASTIIERTRLLHQDIEQNRMKIVDLLLEEVKTHKERVLQENRVYIRLDNMITSGKTLLELYDDPLGARKNELDNISGENVFGVFYDRLKSLREYHRKFKHPELLNATNEIERVKVGVKFSGAECFGKFVDLHRFFEQYVNMQIFLPYRRDLTYLKYLAKFDKFDYINKDAKINIATFKIYKQYITDILGYLISFHKRTHPLVPIEKLMFLINEEFDKLWKAGIVQGWEFFGQSMSKGFTGEAKANVCIEAKEAAENKNNPLYCQPCERKYAKQTTFNNHLTGKKHKKYLKRFKEGKKRNKWNRNKVSKELAGIEFRVSQFANLLREEIEDTYDYVQKKQTRTYLELARDLEEAEEDNYEDEESSEEEGERPIYNPLNLPLGWDGRPIPYWLYKLHGLNIEYKCEICGGYSYWGPRAYERHFTEWRHAYGMRCLGIPNTNHFRHVTRFEDAIALHEKLEKIKATSGWRPDEEEEFEDDEGNVFNKKTYEDLKRQGII